MSFKDLKLNDEILRAIAEKGYEEPTPIQAQAIPIVLEGKDLLGAAQTGTGKTAGFTLPLLQMIADQGKMPAKHVRVLILAPTRELAAQIQANVEHYSKYTKLTSTVVFGGVKIGPQMKKLKGGIDILVATPGRPLDLHNQRAVAFGKTRYLVLDEADRMLDMGFQRDMVKISNLLPERRQTLLFSATFSNEIRKLSEQFLINPMSVDVAPRNAAAASVKQDMYLVDKTNKCQLLEHLFKKQNWYQALVFVRTKYGVDKVAKKLKRAGIVTAAIHGNKSQNHRIRALEEFKKNKCEILVATDIAARGIDIKELPLVVNYDLPQQGEDYVHRIGRTGRAGEEGLAVSFVSIDEGKYLRAIEKVLKKTFEPLIEEGFEPSFKYRDLPKNADGSIKHQKKGTHRGQDRNAAKKPKNIRSRGKHREKDKEKDGDKDKYNGDKPYKKKSSGSKSSRQNRRPKKY